ncbi:MAG: C25 family cysteine peptidase [Flavobacteriales bacterium]
MLLMGASPLAAQYGNEWINYNQPYWKIPVSQDGVYRVSYESLLNSGFPVGSVDPHFIQLYGRGKQLYIHVEGEDDGVINPGDFIEFFGEKNDAWLDSMVYDSPQHVPNPEYSLFNDTIHYFLTIGNSEGLRTFNSGLSDFENYSARDYCLITSKAEFHNEYLIGRQDFNGISLPSYNEAEGWFDFKFGMGGVHEKNIPTDHAYTGPGAPSATVRTISAGASLALGSPNHHLQIGWGSPFQLMVDSMYYGYRLNDISFNLDNAQLGSTTKITHKSINDLGVASDYNAVSYIEIKYARDFDFSNSEFTVFELDNPFNELNSLIEIDGFDNGSPRLFLLKNGNATEVLLTNSDGLWKGIVPMNSAISELMLIESASIQSVSSIEPVSPSGFFTDYTAQEQENTIIFITHPLLWNATQNYAAYREAPDVHTLQVNVEDLYLQYAAGIEKNPLAIKRFCDHLLDTWPNDPTHLFLVGKSIHEANFSSTVGARNDPEKYMRNLVPTWGYPGSDIMMTAGLNGTLFEPAIPTGRLSAQTPSEVLEYLNKVIEHESQEPAMWQKNILHFGGGSAEFEQNTFRTYLNFYKTTAQDTCFGGKVYSFFKNSTDPIQLTVSDSIQLLINQGVSLMTFFGHASATGFDQNIDSPESYNNQGKYPLLIGNSCYTGNIHLSDASSTSENFVLVPNRGVIGFLAKSDLGIPSYLNFYTDNFYKELFVNSYGSSIGKCMQEAIRNFQISGDYYRENVAHNFALHGDPAIKIYTYEKPDYSISASDIFFNPSEVMATNETFEVKIVIENLGKATNDDVGVELVRHYPNGADSVYSITLDRIIYRDTISFALPTDVLTAMGQNTFDVFVDFPLNAVDEMDNTGNNVVLGKSLVITSGDLIPVYPYQFAVTDNSQPTLHASIGFPFEPEKTYRIQADTTDTFDSPWMQQTTITQEGGVVDWQLPVALSDSMVVFWRTSADSLSPEEGFRWHESSFQFIENKTGWGQDHFFQFKDDGKVNLDYNRNSREWEFNPLEGNLKCEVYGSANTTFESLGTLYQIGLNVMDYGGFGFSPSALMVAVIDSTTFMPWESNYNGSNPEHDYGNTLASANSRGRTERYFIFQQNDPLQLQGFADMVSNEIPDGNYLLIYTWQFMEKGQWPSEVETAFDLLDADQILNAPDSLPFIFFMKMGHPETKQEIVGALPDEYLVMNAPLIGAEGQGIVTGPIIGPGLNWDLAEWEIGSLDNAEGDTTRIRLHGMNWLGNDFILSDWAQNPSQISDLDFLINEEQYPFLRFEARVRDIAFNTPPQIDRWHLFYEQAPECAVNPAAGFYLNKDTLQEGEELLIAIAIENISPYDMDSLMVKYSLTDTKNVVHKIAYPLQAPLASGGILIDTLHVDTRFYTGLNYLKMEVNPFDSITQQPHQPEQYHFNNLAQFAFFVEADNINPVLDVTFDGRHILNGDLVSTEPHIVICLDDESPFFLLNEEADTSHFKVFLSTPSAPDVPVYFGSGIMQWTPAANSSNKSRIDFLPQLTEDGKYKLRVQASDKTGNVSGDYDYQIEFEVFSKPSITEVLNYPNPFSTRTQFVFTLTGTEVPEEFKIQIMNISGDIVREITQAELGPVFIGRNLTDYWWDGRDEFGDLLANGVYLYRVEARLHGQSMDLSETSASRFFNRGFGKMYILR